jgi:hypothetical protein
VLFESDFALIRQVTQRSRESHLNPPPYLNLGVGSDAGHDAVDHARDNLAGIQQRLVHAQLNILRSQKHRVSPYQSSE